MAERSRAALHWALVALALWVLVRLLPATGARRKSPVATRTVVSSENVKEHVGLFVQVPSPRRSPYSTDRAPLDGSASRLSRPYLPALDDRQPRGTVTSLRAARVRPYWTARGRVTRWGRRAVTVLAADLRVSFDVRDIHSVLDGVRSR